MDDLYKFVAVVEQRRGSRLEPCVIGGQSMGGLVAAHAGERRWQALAPAVLWASTLQQLTSWSSCRSNPWFQASGWLLQLRPAHLARPDAFLL